MHLIDSALTCFIFINILGPTQLFPGVLPAIEAEPVRVIKKQRH